MQTGVEKDGKLADSIDRTEKPIGNEQFEIIRFGYSHQIPLNEAPKLVPFERIIQAFVLRNESVKKNLNRFSIDAHGIELFYCSLAVK